MAGSEQWVVRWLQEAHNMENALIPILENHAKDAEGHRELQRKIQEHVEVTRRHAQLTKEATERLGASVSAVGTGMAGLVGRMQSMMGTAAEDELIRDGVSDFAAENMEIAVYSALIAAAEAAGDQQTAMVCKQIRADEEDMATFLQTHLPGAVQQFVQQHATA